MTLAKNVTARAARARRVIFTALEETLGVARLGLSPGSSPGILLCGTDMKDDGNDKRYYLSEVRADTAVVRLNNIPRSHTSCQCLMEVAQSFVCDSLDYYVVDFT